MRTGHIGFAMLGACVLAVPALAHHSAAAYDRSNDMVTMSGTVTEYHWVNPHTWVHIRVTGPSGETQEWALEGESIGQYVRIGWTQDRLKIGDAIKATVWPMRDGSYGGQLGFIELEDGTILGERPE